MSSACVLILITAYGFAFHLELRSYINEVTGSKDLRCTVPTDLGQKYPGDLAGGGKGDFRCRPMVPVSIGGGDGHQHIYPMLADDTQKIGNLLIRIDQGKARTVVEANWSVAQKTGCLLAIAFRLLRVAEADAVRTGPRRVGQDGAEDIAPLLYPTFDAAAAGYFQVIMMRTDKEHIHGWCSHSNPVPDCQTSSKGTARSRARPDQSPQKFSSHRAAYRQ